MDQSAQPSYWWLRVDRENIKQEANLVSQRPGFVLLQGSYFESGVGEALTLMATIVADSGIEVVRHVPRRPMSIKARLLACLRLISVGNPDDLTLSALFSSAKSREVVDEIVARAEMSGRQYAFILDDIERECALTWASWEILRVLHQLGKCTVIVSSHKTATAQGISGIRRMKLPNFNFADVKQCIDASSSLINDKEKVDATIRALFANSQVQAPPVVYSTLRALTLEPVS